MRVTQVLAAAGPVDAVTGQALAWREVFRSWEWEGADFAARSAMRGNAIKPLSQFKPSQDEILLLHYSGFARELEPLLESSPRSLLISHNITPPDYFWPYEPLEGVRCTLGREQLAELSAQADVLAGVSEYNAQELRELARRDAEVIPVLLDRQRLGRAAAPPTGPPTILFVGRLTPHKRQDLVIRAFAQYRRLEPDARLVLVGTPLSPAYGRWLADLANESALGAVTFESGLSPQELADRYRGAHAFLCLSEHEGFCIPLLEAFHFGVPVIARDAGAVGEVVGDAGVLLEGDDDSTTVANLLHIVVGDGELRAELRARGERRLAIYDHDRTADRLRQTLTNLSTA
jgi:glycosyltransferase involved in cell wall biosynthesis